MLNWTNRTKSGVLVCTLCGSLIIQTLGIWSCLNNVCEKHTDLPTEKQQGFVGGIISVSAGTASNVSGSVSPSQELDGGGSY